MIEAVMGLPKHCFNTSVGSTHKKSVSLVECIPQYSNHIVPGIALYICTLLGGTKPGNLFFLSMSIEGVVGSDNLKIWKTNFKLASPCSKYGNIIIYI